VGRKQQRVLSNAPMNFARYLSAEGWGGWEPTASLLGKQGNGSP
jgi:hypothetical protein